MLLVIYFVSKYIKSENKRLVANTIISMIFMIPIAIELHYIFNMPISMTFVTLAIGEAGSMIVGGLLIKAISKRVNLYQ